MNLAVVVQKRMGFGGVTDVYYEYVDTVTIASEETLLQDVLRAPTNAKQRMV